MYIEIEIHVNHTLESQCHIKIKVFEYVVENIDGKWYI